MPATATILFPETIIPATGGFDATPLTGRYAEVQVDNRATQLSARGVELMGFNYRTPPLTRDQNADLEAFIAQVGNGVTNFGFYNPFTTWFSSLQVGLTDGADTILVPYRGLDSWSSFLVDGSPVDYGVANEYGLDVLKRDQIAWITVDPPAGQAMVFANVFARRLHICHMQQYRRLPWQGGATAAAEFQPAFPALPRFPMVWEMQFKERA